MTKYGCRDGQCIRKNEEAGTITLKPNTSGLANQSDAFSVRFRNAPVVVVTPYSVFSSYPALTVESRSTTHFYVTTRTVGNVSDNYTIGYYAYDKSPFPG